VEKQGGVGIRVRIWEINDFFFLINRKKVESSGFPDSNPANKRHNIKDHIIPTALRIRRSN
jgi:hypothetical protein